MRLFKLLAMPGKDVLSLGSFSLVMLVIVGIYFVQLHAGALGWKIAWHPGTKNQLMASSDTPDAFMILYDLRFREPR